MISLLPDLFLILTLSTLPAFSCDGSLYLQGAGSLALPNTTIQLQGEDYTFQSITTLGEKDEISGMLKNASSIVEIQVHPFRLSLPHIDPSSPLKQRIMIPDPDGNISFGLGFVPSGLYLLMARSRMNHSILSLAPLLVQEDLVINSPDRLVLGNDLQINVKSVALNHSLAAILLPAEDYRAVNITLTDFLTIQLADKEAILSSIAQERILSLLRILPHNSTIAFEPEAGADCTLDLFTQSDWHPGRYIILVLSYDQKSSCLAQKYINLTE
jgi:hypothetical protein